MFLLFTNIVIIFIHVLMHTPVSSVRLSGSTFSVLDCHQNQRESGKSTLVAKHVFLHVPYLLEFFPPLNCSCTGYLAQAE